MATRLSVGDFYDQQWFPQSPLAQYKEKSPYARNNLIAGTHPEAKLQQSFSTAYQLYNASIDQQEQLASSQLQMAQQQQQQAAVVDQLRIQQDARLQQISSVGNAVAASLRILAAPQATAPTAAVARSKKQAKGARTGSASLRIGSTASGSGAGPNLSI
jgi:DNA-binding protein H-NS